jgi:hypothetical protein
MDSCEIIAPVDTESGPVMGGKGMPRQILGVVVAVTLGLASVAWGQSKCLFKEYDINDLAAILQAEGYPAIQVQDGGRIRFEVDGMPYVLMLYEDGDVRMFCGFAGARLAHEDINDWNRQMRIVKAYIDEEQDPVMVADLLADAGLNEDIVKMFVRYFVREFGPRFRDFVNERNRAR